MTLYSTLQNKHIIFWSRVKHISIEKDDFEYIIEISDTKKDFYFQTFHWYFKPLTCTWVWPRLVTFRACFIYFFFSNMITTGFFFQYFLWQVDLEPSWKCHTLRLSNSKNLSIRRFCWGMICVCTSNGFIRILKKAGGNIFLKW